MIEKYCKSLGYQYIKSKDQSTVQLPNGDLIDGADFFLGKKEKEFSYCRKRGYDIETREVIKNGYKISYPVCINPNAREVFLFKEMKEDGNYSQLFAGTDNSVPIDCCG
jgi:putative hemolysin